MKDYYAILGVSPSAHAADIKRAYRSLAVKYHPDRNPDPTAEHQIKEVNEAYDVLSDPAKRSAYDLKRENPFRELFSQPEPPKHRDPAYRKKRPKPPGWKSEKEKMAEMMKTYYPHARKSLMAAIVFCFVLLLDLTLPFRSHDVKILEVGYDHKRRTHTADVLYFHEIPEIKIAPNEGLHFKVGELVRVNNTRIFKKQFNVVKADGFTSYVPVSIYRSFALGPIILLVLALIGLFNPKNIEWNFNLGIACFAILMLNLVFLLL